MTKGGLRPGDRTGQIALKPTQITGKRTIKEICWKLGLLDPAEVKKST